MNLNFLVTITLLISLLISGSILAQPEGENSVGFTKVRSFEVSPAIRLPGTVVSRLRSTVASEVSGLVIDFPVREGQRIEKGQVLARLRRENIELRLREARAQLKEEEARLNLAEKTMERTRDLLDKGAVSQQDVDDRESEFNSLERRIERLRAVIDQLSDDLDRTVIEAPFAGIVIQESTQVGEWIDVGGAVVELMSMEELEVEIDLPEQYFDTVELGTRSRVTFEALKNVSSVGVISVVIPLADPQARTFPVRLRITNPHQRIGVGMLADVDLPVGDFYKATIAPKDAVIVQGQNRFVFLINSEDTVRQVQIRTGVAVGNWVEVVGPVSPGDLVVTRGNERLRDGMKVRTLSEEIHYDLP